MGTQRLKFIWNYNSSSLTSPVSRRDRGHPAHSVWGPGALVCLTHSLFLYTQNHKVLQIILVLKLLTNTANCVLVYHTAG